MEKEENKPTLESARFIFTQEKNCVDSGDREYEELEIRYESSLGIDRDSGYFLVLNSDSWSIDSIDDLKSIIDRVNEGMNKIINGQK